MTKAKYEPHPLLAKFEASGLRPAPWLTCICYLMHKKHHGRAAKICERLPYEDHVQGFLNQKTGERVLVHHPYFHNCNCTDSQCYAKALVDITGASQAFAEKHGLVVKISDESWYAPGKTLLAEYRIKR